MTRAHLILDFDSTIVSVESLDELAAIALDGRADGPAVLAQIRAITDAGMAGTMPIDESLSQRLALMRFNRSMVGVLAERLHDRVSPSVQEHSAALAAHADRVWVVTSGFHEWVDPVVARLGLRTDHIRANAIEWSTEGWCLGIHPSSALASPRSKPRVVRALGLSGPVIAVGDGITDHEIRADGAASQFIAYTEWVTREAVVARADGVARDFHEVMRVWER